MRAFLFISDKMIILIMYQVNYKYNGKSYDGGRDVQFKAVDSKLL